MTTTEQLLTMDGVAMRQESVRFDVLDSSNIKIGETNPDQVSPPQITNDTTRTIKRSMTGFKLDPAETAAINTLSDRIQPFWILQDGSEFPLGIFLFGDATRTRTTDGIDSDATLVDQMFIIDQERPRGFGFRPGTNIPDDIKALLVGRIAEVSGVAANPFKFIAGKAHAVWPAGTTTLKGIDELATMAGYNSPFFDNTGVLTMDEVPDLELVTPQFFYNEGGTIVALSIVESDDLLVAPNQYVVIDNSGANPFGGAIVGIFDIPDTAPNSFANRGFLIPQVTDQQGLTDQGAADKAAESRYVQDADTFEWISFAAVPDPRHDTFDIVEYLGTKYREVAWSLDLRPGGSMVHNLRRIYPTEEP